MAFMLTPRKRFEQSKRINGSLGEKGIPKTTREALGIKRVFGNGIFLIDDGKKPYIYDRSYLVADINFCNKNDDERERILEDLQKFLNFMSCDFKITIANEYRDMKGFLREVFTDIHKEEYPLIDTGMREFLKQKVCEAEMYDIKQVILLTVTTRAANYDEARRYFLDLDVELEHFFMTVGSFVTALSSEERLSAIRRFFYRDTRENHISTDNPMDDPVMDVIPTVIESGERDFFVAGDQYISVLFGRDYDSALSDTKTIYPLTQVEFPSFVTLDFAPVDQSVFKEMLKSAQIGNERAIAQEMDTKRSAGQLLTGVSYAKNRKKDELEEYRDQVDDNDETCSFIGLLVVITASSEEELANRIETMQRVAKESGIILDLYCYQQLQAFNTALPTGCRLVKNMRPFFSSSATALHPFHAEDLIEPGGQLYGINRTTNHVVFANRKYLKSPHGIIIGHTGGGKSFFLKTTEISQTLLCSDDDLTAIDPQNELQSVCALFGGTFIDFTPKSQVHINPMEVPDDVLEKNGRKEAFVADITEWANSFCAAVMHGINYTQEYSSVVGRAVRNVYERVFSKRKIKQPTIVDLRNELMAQEKSSDNESDKLIIHRIVNSLEEYTDGAYDMFAHKSNVDLSNRFVVFGLANVAQDFWEPVMITVMSFLSNRMEYNRKLRRATRLVIDETQVVTANASSAHILHKAVITYRKFGGICTMAMQNLTRALENPELRDMFSNCGYKCFFDQGGVDAQHLAEIQELSAREYEFLAEETPGNGVMIWGKKVILLNAQMDKENPLYKEFSTNFHEDGTAWEASAKDDASGFEYEEDDHEKPDDSEAELSMEERQIMDILSSVSVTESEIGTLFEISESKSAVLLDELIRKRLVTTKSENGLIYYEAV
ncbi:MAG: hypothetical protein K6F00_02325 [Lachnospiraceae bacterium]|nr:hypothetical protein [Lachnospiraceae bacterium]